MIFTYFIYVLQEITSNQTNVTKRSEDGTKRRKAAKTGEKEQQGAKPPCHPGTLGPCHMARSCLPPCSPFARFFYL